MLLLGNSKLRKGKIQLHQSKGSHEYDMSGIAQGDSTAKISPRKPVIPQQNETLPTTELDQSKAANPTENSIEKKEIESGDLQPKIDVVQTEVTDQREDEQQLETWKNILRGKPFACANPFLLALPPLPGLQLHQEMFPKKHEAHNETFWDKIKKLVTRE